MLVWGRNMRRDNFPQVIRNESDRRSVPNVCRDIAICGDLDLMVSILYLEEFVMIMSW